MIRSFGLLGASELEAPVAITGGIAEALIATGFGLGIAIVALLPLNVISALRAKTESEIEIAASRVEILLKTRTLRAPVKQLRAL
jgi:biopolymer transport protein ExbB